MNALAVMLMMSDITVALEATNRIRKAGKAGKAAIGSKDVMRRKDDDDHTAITVMDN